MPTLIRILTSEVGYGLLSALGVILLTHVCKKMFKSPNIRKRYTPLLTLVLGIVASTIFYTLLREGFDFGQIQSYINISVFGMEIAIAATGIYITIKRIFGKNNDDDISLEDLFNTADKILPQGLLLISNFTGGDLNTAEALYKRVKEEVSIGLTEKKETVKDVTDRVVIMLTGWTDSTGIDIKAQAGLVVQAIKNELDIADKKAQEALKASGIKEIEAAVENKTEVKEENKEIKI